MNEAGSEFVGGLPEKKSTELFRRMMTFVTERGKQGWDLVRERAAPVMVGMVPVLNNRILQDRELPPPESDFFLTVLAPIAVSGYVSLRGGVSANLTALAIEGAVLSIGISNQDLAISQAAVSAAIPTLGRLGVGMMGRVLGRGER